MLNPVDLDLSISDIPSEHMQMVAAQCGISVAISLMQKVPGLELYIPSASKKAIDRNYLRSTFNGSNTASLAVHLGIDNDKIKKMCKVVSKTCQEEPVYTTEHMLIVQRECGDDVVRSLVLGFPNYTIYVPKNGFSTAIRKYILRNYTGFNVASLAIRCGVTERYVRKVISDHNDSTSQCTLDLGI